MMVNDIVNLRNMKKKIKPDFNKQSSHKKKRLANKWRKPRGSDSKIRVGRKGYPRKVKVGFRGPAEARGKSKDGQNIVLIKSMNDLKGLNQDKDVVCLSNFGVKKKINIVKECLKLNLKIISLKDPLKFLSDLETSLEKKKEDKKKKQEEKSKKIAEKKSKEKDKDKKEGIEAKVDDEDKKKEKKEKDKLLTKREV